jgi:hypothetical protein
MESRYSVETISYGSTRLYKVHDRKESRNICTTSTLTDAQAIAKSMNVSNSWEPILMSSEEKANDY